MERYQIRRRLHQRPNQFQMVVSHRRSFHKRSCRSKAPRKLADRQSTASDNRSNNWACCIPNSRLDIHHDNGCGQLVRSKPRMPGRPRQIKQLFVSLFPSLKQMLLKIYLSTLALLETTFTQIEYQTQKNSKEGTSLEIPFRLMLRMPWKYGTLDMFGVRCLS